MDAELSDKKMKRRQREAKFSALITGYTSRPEIRRMRNYLQHGDTTTFDHCKNVARTSYVINETFHLHADERELIEAAMLHDFYLYDWHDGRPERKRHGFDHPYIASRNAVEHFHVSPKVSSAIKSHMWPLNIMQVPNSREAVILCLVDKYCALSETLRIGKRVSGN